MQIFYVQYMHTHIYRQMCVHQWRQTVALKEIIRERNKSYSEQRLEQIEGRLKEIETAWEGGRGG